MAFRVAKHTTASTTRSNQEFVRRLLALRGGGREGESICPDFQVMVFDRFHTLNMTTSLRVLDSRRGLLQFNTMPSPTPPHRDKTRMQQPNARRLNPSFLMAQLQKERLSLPTFLQIAEDLSSHLDGFFG